MANLLMASIAGLLPTAGGLFVVGGVTELECRNAAIVIDRRSSGTNLQFPAWFSVGSLLILLYIELIRLLKDVGPRPTKFLAMCQSCKSPVG